MATAGPKGARLELPTQAEDEVINARVVRELMLQPAVRSDQVLTETREGVVRITGQVPHLLAARRAVQIARSVQGVRAVVDLVEVRPPPRSDARIRSDIVEAWQLDPVTESYQLFLDVQQGRVRLSGQVASHQERLLAEKLAAGVVGVREVTNDVALRPATRRADHEIEADIASRLYWDVRLEDREVEIAVDRGRVRLTGWVVHAADREIAAELAWVQGVHQVQNQVEVRAAERPRLLTKEARPIRADIELEAAVKAALTLDPRVPDGLGVLASDGVITLRGEVLTPLARALAEQNALNTVGVWAVRNELMVRGPSVEDELLGERVERALRRDVWLWDHRIRTASTDGVVYLYGTADSDLIRRRAFEVVAAVPGVRQVADRIVRPPTEPWVDRAPPPAREGFPLAQAVRNRLFWSRYVRAPLIVQVQGRTVSLQGTVSSWFEGYKAELAAWQAGAAQVRSELVVRDPT